jgi:DNA-binding MarR family transcriptional regulator
MADSEQHPEKHPAIALDEVVHQRIRLGLLTVLYETKQADFGYLKKVLNLTDGNLGRHLEVLASNGLVSLRKGYERNRPRTWVSMTSAGRAALKKELDILRSLVVLADELLE